MDCQSPLPMFDFRGKRVTVMGLGRFGGGVGAVQFLIERGARVTLTDTAPAEDLAESLAQINEAALEALQLGGHREDDFLDADLIVASPAVPRDNPFLQAACRGGIPLTSEMNLFWQHHHGKVIGVTGSNGKSTTAAMIHVILQHAGHTSRLGGNIGASLLPIVDQIAPTDWTVLELSSFQLADLDCLFTSPDIAVVTNFRPNHLDWHGSLGSYRCAKQTILRWQTGSGTAVLNHNDPEVTAWKTNGHVLHFGHQCETADTHSPTPPGVRVHADQLLHVPGDGAAPETIDLSLKLPGRHNLENAAAAITATLAIGIDPRTAADALADFTGLPHRLQHVGTFEGRDFYNDSLATTPESAIAALAAFDRPVVLLAGGYDKQIELRDFAAAIATRTRAVALMGQTADLLHDLLEDHSDTARQSARICDCFASAFDWAWQQSRPGDIVLLSPGCASYGWFRNFTERGQQFINHVTALQDSP